MRRHGWGGSPPASEAEAREKIVAATIRCLDRNGPLKLTVSDVAAELGVTRQTVYRYYPVMGDLLTAVAGVAWDQFLAEMDILFKDSTDPAEFAVEATAYVIERIPRSPHVVVMLVADHVELFERGAVTSAVISRNADFLRDRTAVDWTALGYDDRELAELVEFLQRIIQSMVVAPPEQPRDPAQLRAYLRRWVAPAISRPPGAAVPGPGPGGGDHQAPR
jgi:AcrR family transcriptional regulator